MTSLTIRGWRFIGHSYAHVNHHQILELLRRRDVQLSHVDAPFANPAWTPQQGLLTQKQEAAVAAVPPPIGTADAMYRIEFPYDLSPSDSNRTLVFVTVENSVVPAFYLRQGVPIAEAMKNSPATIITPSRWAREGLLRSGVKANQIEVVPHGIDPALFRPLPEAERTALRERLGWSDGFVLLNIGAMTRNKGIDLLLRAVAEVANDVPRLGLVLKGYDAIFDSQTEFLRAAEFTDGALAKLDGRVQYYGHNMAPHQLAELYQAADAYVCPYRAEGFNLPALEAAGCGLPVICTAGGPTDDFILPDFGLKIASTLVQSPTTTGGQEFRPAVESLIAQLRRVVRDTKFREQARTAGPAQTLAHFTWARAVEGLLAAV